MNTDLAILARLNPAAAVAPAEGGTLLDQPIRAGLPHQVALGPRLRGLLVLPTGLARPWLDLPAGTVVSAAADAPDEAAPFGRAAPRLRVQRDKVTIAVLPLVPGLVQEVADAAGVVPLQVQVLDWLLHAGTVRGPGDFGSFLRLAVRAADKGADVFGPLPPSDFVIQRLPPAERIESRGGRTVDWRSRRLVLLKERRR